MIAVQRPGIEPGTSAVLRPRHNQLDHLCLMIFFKKKDIQYHTYIYFIFTFIHTHNISYYTSLPYFTLCLCKNRTTNHAISSLRNMHLYSRKYYYSKLITIIYTRGHIYIHTNIQWQILILKIILLRLTIPLMFLSFWMKTYYFENMKKDVKKREKYTMIKRIAIIILRKRRIKTNIPPPP